MVYSDFPACKGEIVATCLGDKMPLVTRCPAGFKANLTLLPPVCEIVCSEEGVFEYPGDETKYYECVLTTAGWRSTSFNCIQGTYFNKSTKSCDFPFITTTETQTTSPPETWAPTKQTTDSTTEKYPFFYW